jgi:hypothetical protein
MNQKLVMVIACVVLSGASISVNAQQTSKVLKPAENAAHRCKPNSDPLYDRSHVLQELADILNESIPEYSKAVKKGFYTESERGLGFFVVDLTNPANKDLKWNDCVDFIGGHVYHVAPVDGYYSLSQIVILEQGKLKVFKSVNCPGRGDRIDDAINYVSAKLSHDRQRDEIIDRLRNYRKYGSYIRLHHATSICMDPK